jgi:hypothetical protein
MLDYDHTFWDLGTAVRYIDTPILNEYKAPSRDVYCIDVEDTQTFVSGSVVVHNCSLKTPYGCGKKMVEYVFQDANKYGAYQFPFYRYGKVCWLLSVCGSFVGNIRLRLVDRLQSQIAVWTRFFLSIDEAINHSPYVPTERAGRYIVPKAH